MWVCFCFAGWERRKGDGRGVEGGVKVHVKEGEGEGEHN